MPRFIPSSRVTFEQVADEAILVDLDTEKVISLNPVGVAVWTAMAGGAEPSVAVDALHARFAIDRAVIEADVDRFLDSLVVLGVVNVAD
jgi:Coenzyme PQQ synthesis protein D (PqqD)